MDERTRSNSPSMDIPYDPAAPAVKFVPLGEDQQRRLAMDLDNERRRERRAQRRATGEKAPTRLKPSNPLGYSCVNVLVQCAIRSVKKKATRRRRMKNLGPVQRAARNARNAKWSKENKERVKQMIADWMKSNRERMRTWENQRNLERRKTDMKFVVKRRVRSRLTGYLNGKGVGKADKTFNQVECTPDELLAYLSDQLRDGDDLVSMRIDHIFPMDAYNVTDDESQANMMHWSNMQPLTAFENSTKSNKLPTKAMAAKVDPICWPDGITMDMLPDIYPGWATPLRMHAPSSPGAGSSSDVGSSSSSA
jgi:hypothetical protein